MQIRPWIILASLALARIAFGYQFQTVATLGTELISQFGLSYARLGSLIGAYNLFGMFIALPIGLIGRRFGDRLVLATGIALMTAGACFSAWSGEPPGIAAGRAISGAGGVAMIVLQGKIIADWFAGPRFMIAISISVCAFPVGMGLAGWILAPVAQAFGLQAAFLTCAVPSGLALVLFLASYRTLPGLAPAPRRVSLPSGRECLLLVVAGAVWTTYTSGYSAFMSYLPTSLSQRGYGLALTGLVMAVAAWGNVPATLAGGGLAARFGGFRIFLIGTASLVIGMLGCALTGFPLIWATVLGVMGSIHPGVMMAVGTLSARPENRTVGMGLFYTVYYVGGFISPTVCGIAADYAERPEGGLLAAAVISATVVPLFMLHRRLTSHALMLVQA
jgi:MFS family permease